MAASTDWGSVTSSVTASAFRPAATISSATGRALSPRAAATTVAPRRASASAVALPMPRDAPVTSATREVKSIM